MTRKSATVALFLLVSLLCLPCLWAGEDLADDFRNPPQSARLWTWWFWLGDRVDKASITADLEALKAQGIAGVTVYSLGGPHVTERGPTYLSPEWRELWKHALKEADRLGLGVSTMLSSGWNCGGPWITPELACKKHVHCETVVTGPQHFRAKLPQPAADPRFYRDVAVQAFPVDDRALGNRLPADLLAWKALGDSFGNAFDTPIREICDAPRRPLPPQDAATMLDPTRMIDVTARCAADGTLDWQAPAGRWLIVRIGYTLTGRETSCSSPTCVGLEADPLSAAAMDTQFARIAGPLLTDAGPLAGKVFRSVQIDSWETELPNWTPDFVTQFTRRRGYDPRPYLAALSGRCVRSPDATDRFLYDYRKTLGECVTDNYFGRLSELAASRGIVQQSEAGGPCCPKVMAMDALANLGRCAIPMGEFWQDGIWVESDQNKNGKQTASAAHIYGKPIVAAEAFTSMVHWVDSPASLKPTADRAFCEGFNRFFIFSTATHSDDGIPGTEFYAGTHFNRKITWWRQARCFTDYVARCSLMLQQGRFVADVLFYNGDGTPNFVAPTRVDPRLGRGYDFDVCNTEVLLTRLTVRDGRIVLPDGMSYRLLVLPDRRDMPVEVLVKLKELVAAGMTLVGPKPDRASGLTDYPQCDRQLEEVAGKLWGDCDGQRIKEHPFGQGRVVCGKTPRETLSGMGVGPDFSCTGDRSDAFIDWIHRNIAGPAGADVYFLANRRDRVEHVNCEFRQEGKLPELWNAVSGETRPAAGYSIASGKTRLRLTLAPYESVFVVFRNPASAAESPGSNSSTLETLRELTGPWTVAFDPRWGGPSKADFRRLVSWTKRPEEGIRFYSGAATYRTAFDLAQTRDQAGAANRRIYVDLGAVQNLAEIRLNGQDLGIVWTAPWRVDITRAARPGANVLEIRVTNLWPNRLIGDASLPKDKRLTSTNIPFNKDQPLLESGLLGPVRVMREP
jgi:hypothetical protein